MDELIAKVRARMDDARYVPGLQYAEILWMTESELAEYQLHMVSIPSFGQMRIDAKRRIMEKRLK